MGNRLLHIKFKHLTALSILNSAQYSLSILTSQVFPYSLLNDCKNLSLYYNEIGEKE